MAEPAQAVEFLTALWGGPKMPAKLLMALWIRQASGKSSGFAAEHWMGVEATVITNRRHDVYVHAAGLSKKPPKHRATIATAAAIPGLWLDVDVNGGPEGRTGAAPNVDSALALIHHIAPPSIIVDSGYGLHAWWRFAEPWVFTDDAERDEASLLVKRWEEAHRRVIGGAWKLDPVGELARVMRLPGTLNHKGGAEAPVSLISTAGDPFPRQALAEQAEAHTAGLVIAPGAAVRADTAALVEGGELPGYDEVPWEKLRAVRMADETFDRTWTRKRNLAKGEFRDDDDSSWDYAILNRLDNMGGFTDREIIALARSARREYGNPAKADKLDRADYWWGSLAKLRRERKGEQLTAGAKQAESEVVAELHELSTSVPSANGSDATARWATFNKALGLQGQQRAVTWKQSGRDPRTAQHTLILADGTEVPLGTHTSAMNQPAARSAMTVAARIPYRMTKQGIWNDAWNAILPLRIDEEQTEDERANIALHWVAAAIERGGIESDPAHHEEAIREYRPILKDGRVWITTRHLGRHLRVAEGRRDVKDTDLPPLLAAAGFDRGKLNYTKPEAEDGKRSSASYWSIDAEHLP